MDLFGSVISVHGVPFLMFCVFLIASAGYLLGRIAVRGVKLGTAGVFLAALLFGGFFQTALAAELGESTKNALKIIENIGLVMFVTSVGFIAGPNFFVSIRNNIRSYAALGAIIILAGGLTAIACIYLGRLAGETDPRKMTAMAAGLFSGAMTSTPAFSAAKSTIEPAYEDIVSVGYGIAYIFGVAGVVLFVQIIPRLHHADMQKELALISVQAKERAEKDGKEDGLIHTDPFGIMPLSLAIVLGILVGMIRIPLTLRGLSGTAFSLTTTGEFLLMALLMGHLGRAGKISLMPYQSSLKVFREFGLCLFLIGAGVSAGAQFKENFAVLYFFFGVAITLVSMIVGYFFAIRVLKMHLLNALSAITGGMTSTPALGTLIAEAGSEDVAAAYAATYPVALICIVLMTQILILVA